MSRSSAVSYLASLREHFDSEWGPDGHNRLIEHFSPYGFTIFPGELTGALEKILDSFLPLTGKEFLRTARGVSKIEPFNIANAMIERVAVGVTAESVVSDWEDLLLNRMGRAASIIALFGVNIDSPIQIAPDMHLVPAGSIPPTRERELIFKIDRAGEKVVRLDAFQEPWSVPSAALVITAENCYLIADGGPITDQSSVFQRENTMQAKALAAITLSGECGPVTSWKYGVALHPAIPYGRLGGMGGGRDIAAAAFSIRSGFVNSTLLTALYEKLDHLDDGVWNSLRLSIDRLGRSRNHQVLADRAIDLGIAVESSLLHGETGTGAKGELRTKVGLRGAWLIGQGPEDRERIFKALRSAYDLRSAAVHTGALDGDKEHAIQVADSICSRILRAIIDCSHFPDWTRVTLGFGIH